MADILIRGMEIPKNCSSCKIVCWNYLEHGINGLLAKLSASQSRDPNCPLDPLPAGHGRLIDADAAIKEAYRSLQECEKYGNEFQKPYEVLRAIETAKTIVPAEGGDNE